MKIGVISDTHGLFDPRVPGLFAGVDHILHGGDVGPDRILHQLERIAPVTAVLGNTDSSNRLRETELITLGGFAILLHHIVDPHTPPEAVRRHLAAQPVRVVVYGHTHQPFSREIDGVLFFNPGAAGPKRFNLPRTVGLLHLDEQTVRAEILHL